jgi:hypothetical protein
MPVIGWMLDGEIVTFEEAERFAERYGDWRGWTPFALEAMRKQVARTDGLWISPSQALECPRLRILKPAVPYYVNPEYTWAALVGSAVHARILVGEGVELPLSADLDVGDESIPVMGTCDYFRDGVLYDVKVTSRLDERGEAGARVSGQRVQVAAREERVRGARCAHLVRDALSEGRQETPHRGGSHATR